MWGVERILWFSISSRSSRLRGESMHLVDPASGMLGSALIVAGTISLATGAALASSIRGDGRVTVSFFGDGAAGEGVLYESLNFASLKKLPILFVCENNFYSTHMPIRECRVDSNIYKVAEPFCIRSVQIDGNDVLEVYEAGKQAIEQCRKGDGPVFMECLTYRLRGHVGPDDNIQGSHTDIRPREEIKEWKKKDPIKRFERYLQENEVMDEEEIEEIKKYIQAQMEEALQFASARAFPDPRDLDKNVFAQ